MQTGYPDGSIAEMRTQGIWPVTSLSTDRYRVYLPAVVAALTENPSTESDVSILDIGASFGDSLAHFAHALREQAGLNPNTVALDVNRQTLLGAQHRRNADNVVWGRAQELPFGVDTFDVVLVKKLVAFLPSAHQSRILREIERVLVPTGVVGVELDSQGTDTLDTSSHWLLSGETLGTLRKETDGFERYPLPLDDSSDCVRLSTK